MEIPPKGIKSYSAEPELELVDSSLQAESKSSVRRLQKANQDLSKRNLQLSKSVESLKKEKEQLIADKERLKAEKKSLARKRSVGGLKRTGRSMSEGSEEIGSASGQGKMSSELELQNRLASMEDLVAERDREISELKRQLSSQAAQPCMAVHEELRQVATSENIRSQNAPEHFAHIMAEEEGISHQLKTENSELRSRVASLENELRILQQQKPSCEPSPEPKQRKKFSFPFRKFHRRQDSASASVSTSTEASPKSSKKHSSRSSMSVPLEMSVSENDLHGLSIGRRSEASLPGQDLSLLQAYMRSALEERLTLERKLESTQKELQKAEEKIEKLTSESSMIAASLQTAVKERDAALQENKKLKERTSSKSKGHHQHHVNTDLCGQQYFSQEVERLRAENISLSEEAMNLSSKTHHLEATIKQLKRETMTRDLRENELRALYQRKQEEVEVLAAELRIAYEMGGQDYAPKLSPTKMVEEGSRPYDPSTPSSPPKWRRVTHKQNSPSATRQQQQQIQASVFANLTSKKGSQDAAPLQSSTSPHKRRASQNSTPTSPTKFKSSISKKSPSPERRRVSTVIESSTTASTTRNDTTNEPSSGREKSSTKREYSLPQAAPLAPPAKVHTSSQSSQPPSPSKKQSSSSSAASPKKSLRDSTSPPHSQPSPSTGQIIPAHKSLHHHSSLPTHLENHKPPAPGSDSRQETETVSLSDKVVTKLRSESAPISIPAVGTTTSRDLAVSPETPVTMTKTQVATATSADKKDPVPASTVVVVRSKVLKQRVVSVPRLSPISSTPEDSSITPPLPPSPPSSPPPTSLVESPKQNGVMTSSIGSTSSGVRKRRASIDSSLGSFSPTSPTTTMKQTPGVNSLVQMFNQMVGPDSQKPSGIPVPVATPSTHPSLPPPLPSPAPTLSPTYPKPKSPPVVTTTATTTTSTSTSSYEADGKAPLREPVHSNVGTGGQKIAQRRVTSEKTVVTSEKTVIQEAHREPVSTNAEASSGTKKMVLALRKSFEGIKEKMPPDSSRKVAPTTTNKREDVQEHTTSKPVPASSSAKPLSPKGSTITDIVRESHTPTAITPLAISKPKPPPVATQKTKAPAGSENGVQLLSCSPSSSLSSAAQDNKPTSPSMSNSPQQKTQLPSSPRTFSSSSSSSSPSLLSSPKPPSSTTLTASSTKTTLSSTATSAAEPAFNPQFSQHRPIARTGSAPWATQETKSPLIATPTAKSVKLPPGVVRPGNKPGEDLPAKAKTFPSSTTLSSTAVSSSSTASPVTPAQQNGFKEPPVILRRGATVASMEIQKDLPRKQRRTEQNGAVSAKMGHRPTSIHVTGGGDKLTSLISKLQEKEVTRSIPRTTSSATVVPHQNAMR